MIKNIVLIEKYRLGKLKLQGIMWLDLVIVVDDNSFHYLKNRYANVDKNKIFYGENVLKMHLHIWNNYTGSMDDSRLVHDVIESDHNDGIKEIESIVDVYNQFHDIKFDFGKDFRLTYNKNKNINELIIDFYPSDVNEMDYRIIGRFSLSDFNKFLGREISQDDMVHIANAFGVNDGWVVKAQNVLALHTVFDKILSIQTELEETMVG